MSNKRFLKAHAEREVSISEFLEIAAAIVGKPEQEKDAILEKYAEKIEKNNPLRERPLKFKTND